MSERASKLRATRDRSEAIAAIAAGAQKDTYTFSTTLHGCLATPSCGLAVNADNVITAVLQDSPATARMHVHALGPPPGLLAVPHTYFLGTRDPLVKSLTPDTT